MSEHKMSELIRASLDGVRDFAGVDTVVGHPIETAAGVTVIPVSKVTVGLATGGVDLDNDRLIKGMGFGGGGGTGITVTPLAFLTVSPDASIALIPVAQQPQPIGDLAALLDRAPDVLRRVKEVISEP